MTRIITVLTALSLAAVTLPGQDIFTYHFDETAEANRELYLKAFKIVARNTGIKFLESRYSQDRPTVTFYESAERMDELTEELCWDENPYCWMPVSAAYYWKRVINIDPRYTHSSKAFVKIVLHEFAHAFGLDHGEIMGQTSRDIGDVDKYVKRIEEHIDPKWRPAGDCQRVGIYTFVPSRNVGTITYYLFQCISGAWVWNSALLYGGVESSEEDAQMRAMDYLGFPPAITPDIVVRAEQ